MEKNIFIYGQDMTILNFLRSFFENHKKYSPIIVKRDIMHLKSACLKKKPAALLVESPFGFKHLDTSEIPCPVIALISSDSLTSGIRSVLKADVDSYLISPFYQEDLDYKLKVAMARRNWIQHLDTKKKDLESLLEFTCLISATLDPKEALHLIVQKIAEIIRVTHCSIISINTEDQDSAYVVSSYKDSGNTNTRLDLGKYPEIKQAILLKKPFLVKNALKDPLMKDVVDILKPLGVRSIAVFPVIFRDEIIGILLLRASKAGRTFTAREMNLCSAIANTSANALYNAFLHQKVEQEKIQLERLAITDYMTGIYNIRYFYSRLEDEFSRSGRYNTPMGCIMFDIDYFKRVNDTYGHRIGDIVLREFAQLIRGRTRRSDIFARYGGEEFIMILPEIQKEEAIMKAEELRKVVEEYRFMGLEDNDRITVSMGIACIPDAQIKTPDDLISVTDQALFAAKHKGRNQIIVFPDNI